MDFFLRKPNCRKPATCWAESASGSWLPALSSAKPWSRASATVTPTAPATCHPSSTFASDKSLEGATRMADNYNWELGRVARKVHYEQSRLGSIRLALAKVAAEDRNAKKAVETIVNSAELAERTGCFGL